ncbi:secreted RxLR effector protein 161-like [Capsicum annuum]|uniref:secreted RxLR effector protein 161-like n=1 Tax=Capsicum annuum TaxID=4072 RepID=UPI001FB11949|nr:secreted RxLR effector protein 161-like [Capsicum annuum]
MRNPPKVNLAEVDEIIAAVIFQENMVTHIKEGDDSEAVYLGDSKTAKALDKTKSASGYVFTLGGGAISWKSAKQTIIVRSTMESEFVALKLAGTEAEWLRNFLANIPFTKDDLMPLVSIHCDCQAELLL